MTVAQDNNNKMVTIPVEEYRSLLACAELVKHPEVLVRTIDAIKRDKTIPFEEAFKRNVSTSSAAD